MGLTSHSDDQVLDEIFNAGAGSFPAANLYVSLHSGIPGPTGANEISGPSYARQQTDFAASGSGTLANVGGIAFANMPAVTLVGWGAWDAASGGNCWATGCFSTLSGLVVVRAADLIGNDLQTVAHGRAADDRIAFEIVEGLALPTGLSAATLYYVIAAGLTTDAFRVASTSGGSAIDITAVGSGIWRRVVPVAVGAGQTFTIAAGDLDIYADAA